MSNSKSFKRWIAMLLCLIMTLSMVIPATATKGTYSPNGASGDRVLDAIQKEYLEKLDPNEVIRVSIVLEKASTLEAGYSTLGIASNKNAMNYRDGLRAEQATVQTAIERKLGKDLDVVWNLTLAANIISANVRRGDIAAIRGVDGVKSVYIEKQYSPDVVSKGGTADPNMAIAGMIDGARDTWLAGYTGEGALIAIIDTGLDINHQSFDNGAFLAAVNKANLKLDEETVKSVANQLNAVKSERATADQLYRNEKIPFGWNYIDSGADITHDNDTQGEHGSHVAGIAAANRLVDTDGDGEYEDALTAVQVAGNAPDAQIMVMKVFGKAGGAYDSDCAAAIEDAITLGADAVNLSLGMALPGFAAPQEGDPYAEIQNLMVESDTVVVFSAGNAGSWAENTYNGYLYNDGVSYQFDGESGSYTNSFTVASVDNGGFIGATFAVDGKEYGFNETSGYGNPPFGATLDPDGKGTTYKFVMVEFAAAGHDAEIVGQLPIDSDTIYITWRGGTSFFEKGNAGYSAGAAAVIVGNNQPGSINMDLTGYEGDIPVVSTFQVNADEIWDSVADKQTAGGYQYITGTITVNGATSAHAYNTGYYTMSSFSSWGTTGDLALKPEISAFGGSIYSVWGSNKSSDSSQSAHDQYELMSGTSMAAPQITGMSALVQQYLRDKGYDLDGATSRAITMGLLMATAEPMKDADGNYYSLLQQGAGLANVLGAITSPVYITMSDRTDGKVKAELGDDFYRNGEYVVEFDIHNLTGDYYTYEIDLDAFTQAYFEQSGNKFLDYATRGLDVDVEYEINGQLWAGTKPDLRYDFDGDGDIDKDDAQLLLDHIIKGEALVANEENADVNGDGEVNTYDVHVLLNTDLPELNVGADEVHVKVTFKLTEEEKKTLNAQNPGGAYIEAFLRVKPVADVEGVLVPELSIPVLGYYGSWTDASMYEVGTAEEWYNRTNNGMVGGRLPYTYLGAGQAAYNLTLTNLLYQGSAAVSLSKSNVLLNGADAGNMSSVAYRFSPIRNYGNGVVQITDSTGKVLWRSADFGASYGLLYYENAGFWIRADLSGSMYYNLYQDVTIDWATAMKNITPGSSEVTVTLMLAPEYYAQYGYDWDLLTDGIIENGELGEGAKLSTTLQLDLEAPVIGNITIDGTTPANRTITVELTDNKALATARLYDESGNPNNFTRTVRNTGYESKTASGTSATVTFNGGDSGNTTGYLYDAIYRLEVTDTAGNTTTLRFEVGDVTFTDVPETVTPSETSIEVMKGSTYNLTAEVGPYNLSDDAKGVTWSSKNPEIATVDANGVVTGVSKGNATIVVSTVSNGPSGEPVTAEVSVEVFTLPIVATGILGDENGYAKFFEWDFEEGTLSYDKAEESEVVYPLALTTYEDGTFLAIDGDGTIYVIDAEGNELYSSPYAYDGMIPYDIAYTENAGFYWTQSNFIMPDNPFAPEGYGYNMGQHAGTYGNIYAMAIVDEHWEDDGDSGEYLLYALTDKGYIYEFMIDDVTGSASISVYNLASLGMDWTYEGYMGDTYGNMVIGDDGAFYISIMRNNTNELYRVLLTKVPNSTSFSLEGLYMGNFGDGVWPGLLLTVGNKPTGILYDFNNDGVTDELDAQVLLRAVVRDTATDDMDVNKDGKVTTRDVYDLLTMIDAGEFNSVKGDFTEKSTRIRTKVMQTKSGLKADKRFTVVPKNDIGGNDASVDVSTHVVVVPITVNDVNNGLFQLTYDTDELTYSGNKTPSSALTHVYAKDDTVKIGFAGLDTLTADTVVAEITFTYEAADEDRDLTVTLSVIEEDEIHNDNPVTEEIEVTLPGENLPSYLLTGILTDDNFNVKQFTWDTAEAIGYDHTFASLWNPVVAANDSDDEYFVIDYNMMTEAYDTYKVNKTTGAATLLASNWSDPANDMVPWDIANGGDDFYGIWGVYGYYIFTNIAMDEAVGEQSLAAWNFSSYNQPYFMGVAVADEAWTNSSASGTKVVYAIADDGNVWKLMPYETATGTSASFQRIAYTGLPDLYYDVPWATDDATGTSLVVGDDGALYFSCIDADLEASVVYRLTLEGNTYVGKKIAETDYWVYPALLLDASAAEKTPGTDPGEDPVESPVDLTFNGIAQEYDGIYWAEITTKNGPKYDRLYEISDWMNGPMLTTAAIDLWNETLYAATMEMDDTAVFYEVDPKTFKTKKIGTSQFAYTDMADAMGLNYNSGGKYVVASYGPYVLLVNAKTGQQEGILWASGGQTANGPEIVGIAFAGLAQYDATTYVDVYYLVDVNGDIHLTGFMYYLNDFYSLTFNGVGDNDVLFSTGYSTDINIYNSLYYVFPGDTTPGYIVWSCFNYGADAVDLIVIDEDTEDVYNIGSFDEGVWPIGGLVTLADATNRVNAVVNPGTIASIEKVNYNMEVAPVATTARAISAGTTVGVIETTTVNTASLKAEIAPMTVRGSLNSVEVPVENDDADAYPKDTVTIPVYASASTNGEFILSYDTDVLKLETILDGAMLVSYVESDGEIHVGYADKNEISANVVNVTFTVLDPDAIDTTVTLTVLQDGEAVLEEVIEVDNDIELDHVWNTEPTFDWSYDGKSATATFTCTINGEHTITVDADVVGVTTVPATCTVDGTTTYTATVEFEGETYFETLDLDDIRAIGHGDYYVDETLPTCSEDGKVDVYCGRCDTLLYTEVLSATGEHVCSNATVTEPTCEEDGSVVLVCDECGTTIQTIVLPATGHAWTATFNWAEDGKSATVTFTCANDEEHTETITATVTSAVKTPATCEEVGTTTYIATVTFNGVTYTDTKDVDDIDATGHAWIAAFNWAEDGKSATVTFTCANDEEHTETVTAEITSEMKTAATCEEDGTTTYTATVVFGDVTYTFTKDVDDIAATGHTYGEPVITWTEDGKSVTATFTCENDAEHTKTVAAAITSEVKTAATCEEVGTTTYTATITLGDVTYTFTKDVDDIAATGHTYGEPVMTWNDDGKSATATFTCEIDGHVETVEATITSEVKVEATATEDGTTIYTATFEFNGKSYTATMEVTDIPATGTPNTPDDPNSPQTGDSNRVVLWASLILLSMFGVYAIVALPRKVFDEGK